MFLYKHTCIIHFYFEFIHEYLEQSAAADEFSEAVCKQNLMSVGWTDFNNVRID